MIKLAIKNAGVFNLVAKSLGVAALKLRPTMIKRLREAGRIVRKKERELLRGGYGPKLRKIRRTSKKTGKSKSSSRLASEHRSIIRKHKNQDGVWEVFVGPTPGGKAFYGKFFETGTGERKTGFGASRGVLPPSPWMGPAINQVRPQVEKIIEDTFRAVRIVGV